MLVCTHVCACVCTAGKRRKCSSWLGSTQAVVDRGTQSTTMDEGGGGPEKERGKAKPMRQGRFGKGGKFCPWGTGRKDWLRPGCCFAAQHTLARGRPCPLASSMVMRAFRPIGPPAGGTDILLVHGYMGTWYLGQPIPPWGEGSLSKKNPVYWSITFEKLVGHSPGGGHIAMGRNGGKSVDVDRFFFQKKIPCASDAGCASSAGKTPLLPGGRGIQIQTPVSGRSGFGHSNDQGP